MHVAIRLIRSLCLVALAACGTSASDGQGGSPGAGGGTGAEGQGGDLTGGGGSGGACPAGDPTIDVEVTTPAGQLLDADDVVVLDGIARFEPGQTQAGGEDTPASLHVDTCLPSQDCAPSEWTITFPADAAFTVPEGTFVRAVVTSDTALVRNLPTLDGLENPTAGDARLWAFVTGDGALDALGEPADRGGVSVTRATTCEAGTPHVEAWDSITLGFVDATETLTLPPATHGTTTVTSGPAAGAYAAYDADCGRRSVLDPFCSYSVLRLPDPE